MSPVAAIGRGLLACPLVRGHEEVDAPERLVCDADSREPVLGELGTPRQHRWTRYPDNIANLRIRHAIGGQQQRASPLDHPMRRGPRICQDFQNVSLTIGYRQPRRCSTHI